MVPAMTLLMLLAGRLERFSMPVFLDILAITLGTSLTAMLEVPSTPPLSHRTDRSRLYPLTCFL